MDSGLAHCNAAMQAMALTDPKELETAERALWGSIQVLQQRHRQIKMAQMVVLKEEVFGGVG